MYRRLLEYPPILVFHGGAEYNIPSCHDRWRNQVSDTVEYRDIPGYVGYRAGSDGSIWSRWTAGRSASPTGPWRQMRTPPIPSGHLQVNLRGRVERVHTLILLAFVGPPPAGMECRHFPDRNPANNRIENLSWGTRKENVDDKLVQGTYQCGENRAGAKLTDAIVRDIKFGPDQAKGSQKRLSIKYNIDPSIISEIRAGKRWKHITQEPPAVKPS